MRGQLPTPIATQCKECGGRFETTHPRKVFCGDGCKNRFYDRARNQDGRRDIVGACAQCGEAFVSRTGRGRFCSRRCAGLARWESGVHTFPTGAEHPGWRGGERAARRRKAYGIEPDQYEALLASQGGVCAICRANRSSRPLCVDHDHATGRVRGLLCGPCNSGLGLYGERPEWLLAAVAYLAAQGDGGLPVVSEQ